MRLALSLQIPAGVVLILYARSITLKNQDRGVSADCVSSSGSSPSSTKEKLDEQEYSTSYQKKGVTKRFEWIPTDVGWQDSRLADHDQY